MIVRSGAQEKDYVVDELAEKHGWRRIDILSIDAEGHDPAVLRGARRMLSRSLVAICAVKMRPRSEERLAA